MRRRALLLIAGVGLCCGCSTTVVRRNVERRAEKMLPRILGPADRYDVRMVGTRDSELVRGRARKVEVEGQRIRARGQMLVDSMRLVAENVRYTGKEPYRVAIGRSDLQVEFTDAAVNEYLEEFQPQYRFAVRFERDRVHVKLVYPLLGAPTPISGYGKLVVEDGTRLIFRAERVDLALLAGSDGKEPGFNEKLIEEKVNPLLDMTEIDFPARLEAVTVLDGRIRARGSASLPQNVKH